MTSIERRSQRYARQQNGGNPSKRTLPELLYRQSFPLITCGAWRRYCAELDGRDHTSRPAQTISDRLQIGACAAYRNQLSPSFNSLAILTSRRGTAADG